MWYLSLLTIHLSLYLNDGTNGLIIPFRVCTIRQIIAFSQMTNQDHHRIMSLIYCWIFNHPYFL